MRLTPKLVIITLIPIAVCGLLCVNRLRVWYGERQVVLALCEGTKFHHAKDQWSDIVRDSDLLYRSPTTLRNSILQRDFLELNTVIREMVSASAQHKAELQRLGPAASKDEISRLEMRYNTGIYERLTIHQQVIWQEISQLRNWRPGLSVRQVQELTKSFDHQGLEVFTSTAIKALH
jgi:hypothetical protein